MSRPPTKAWLVAHGRLPWSAARVAFGQATSVWADLDGFQAGPAPADAPIATHLWAWADDRLFRARIDGAEAIVAELTFAETDQAEPVKVIERAAATWPENEGRVSVAAQWRARPVTLYEVVGLMPLTFARLHEPPGASPS